MKYFAACIIVIAALVLGLLYNSGFVSKKQKIISKSSTEAIPTTTRESDSKNIDALCGPRCVVIAAARIGIPIDMDQITTHCRITANGASMLELKKAVEKYAMTATGARLTWDQLIGLDTPVVVYLNANHFAVIDPREKESRDGIIQVRLYDFPKSARWVGQDDLAKQWHGEALIIRKSTENHAQLEFTSLLEDFGLINSQSTVTHDFNFRNNGTNPLKILAIKKTCGCTKAEASSLEIPPQGSGKVTFAIDLKGRQGLQRQVVYVKTNDAQHPILCLTLQGHVVNPIHISTEAINLGSVIPGASISEKFIITDRGDGRLALSGSHYVPKDKNPQLEQLAINATFRQTDTAYDEMATTNSSQNVKTLIRGHGDQHFAVDLSIKVPAKASLGLHEGTLVIDTNDRQQQQITIPVVYNIIPTIFTEVSKVSFGIVRPKQVVTREISLERLDGVPLQISDYSFTADGQAESLRPVVEVHNSTTSKATLKLILTPASGMKEGLHRGSIRIQTKEQPSHSITLPWICIIKNT